MNRCDPKQKAFAHRVYLDLKITRKWSELRVHFDENRRWIFFVGKSMDDEPLVIVLPISSDTELTSNDLFVMQNQLSNYLPSHIADNVQGLVMAIIANDLTLGYFNFSLGLNKPSSTTDQSSTEVSTIDDEEFREDIVNINTDWPTTETNKLWD